MASSRYTLSSDLSSAGEPVNRINQQTAEGQLRRMSTSSDTPDDDASNYALSYRQQPIDSVPIHNTFLNLVSHPVPLYAKSLSMPEEVLGSEDIPQVLDGARISRQVDALFFKPKRSGRCMSGTTRRSALERVPEVGSHFSHEQLVTSPHSSSQTFLDTAKVLPFDGTETNTPEGSSSTIDSKTSGSARSAVSRLTENEVSRIVDRSHKQVSSLTIFGKDQSSQCSPASKQSSQYESPRNSSIDVSSPSSRRSSLALNQRSFPISGPKQNPLEYLTFKNEGLGMTSLEYSPSPIQNPESSFSRSGVQELQNSQIYKAAEAIIRQTSIDLEVEEPQWMHVLRESGPETLLHLATLDDFEIDCLVDVNTTSEVLKSASNEAEIIASEVMNGTSFIRTPAAMSSSVKPINGASSDTNITTVESEADAKNAISPEELTSEILIKIPKDESGNFLSYGSIGHADGTCKGHFLHAPKKRVRLSKKKRAEVKMLYKQESSILAPGEVECSLPFHSSNSYEPQCIGLRTPSEQNDYAIQRRSFPSHADYTDHDDNSLYQGFLYAFRNMLDSGCYSADLDNSFGYNQNRRARFPFTRQDRQRVDNRREYRAPTSGSLFINVNNNQTSFQGNLDGASQFLPSGSNREPIWQSSELLANRQLFNRYIESSRIDNDLNSLPPFYTRAPMLGIRSQWGEPLVVGCPPSQNNVTNQSTSPVQKSRSMVLYNDNNNNLSPIIQAATATPNWQPPLNDTERPIVTSSQSCELSSAYPSVGSQLVIVPSPNSLVLKHEKGTTTPTSNTSTCLSPLLFPQPIAPASPPTISPSSRSFVYPPGPQFPGSLSPNMVGVQSAHRLLSPMAVASAPPNHVDLVNNISALDTTSSCSGMPSSTLLPVGSVFASLPVSTKTANSFPPLPPATINNIG